MLFSLDRLDFTRFPRSPQTDGASLYSGNCELDAPTPMSAYFLILMWIDFGWRKL